MSTQRRQRIAGGLLFVVAFALRAAYIASVASEPAVRYPVLDALAYHEWALAILDGNWIGDQVYYQDPLYPFFLAGLYAVFGPGSLGVLLAQGALDAVSVVLLYATTLRLFGFKTAVVAGLLGASYAPYLFYCALLLKAPLLLFLFNTALFLLVRAATGERLRGWLAAGIALGFAVLTRANALLFLPALFVWMAFDRQHSAARRVLGVAAVIAGIALVLVPIALRNYAIGGDLVLVNSQGGQNFYIGNFRSNDTGAYRAPSFLRADPRYEESDFAREAEEQTGRELTPSEVSDYWLARGLEEIRADPGHFLRHTAKKLAVLVNRHEIADNYSFDFVAEYAAPLLRLPLPSYGLLLPFAFCGAAFARRQRAAWLPLAFALAYASSLLVFFNLSRLRLPIVPVVIAFGAYGLVEIASRLRQKQLRAAAPALAFLLLAYPLVYADIVTDWQEIRHWNLGQRHMGVGFDHRKRAVLLSEQGDERAARTELELARAEIDQAEQVYRRGLETHPNSRRLRMGLRDLQIVRLTDHHRLKQYDRALAVAEQLVSEYPGHAPSHAWLGTLRARLGRSEEAAQSLTQALELDPNNVRAKRELRWLRRERK